MLESGEQGQGHAGHFPVLLEGGERPPLQKASVPLPAPTAPLQGGSTLSDCSSGTGQGHGAKRRRKGL